MFRMLDAKCVSVNYDAKWGSFVAARDPIGVRPLYYGYSESGNILLRASLRAVGLDRGSPLPTRPLLRGRPVCPYQDIAEGSDVSHNTLSDIFRNMHDKLVGIAKRLDTDEPAGFLLSGGLDSSPCLRGFRAAAEKSIRTFAIGTEGDAIDLTYVRAVVDYISCAHTDVLMTREDVLSLLEKVISILGTMISRRSAPEWGCTCSAWRMAAASR